METSTTIAERFILDAVAGSGGMGTVYRARDAGTGQVVAVKLLRQSDRPTDAERFAREATILAQLRHPGIVEYLAHGVTPAGQPYLAMEWLEGEDLSRRLSRGPLGLSESLTLLRCAAEALAVAHARGVVHRDLKPSNLFLRGGAVEKVALLDFGIARWGSTSAVITRTGVVMGTPAYMAPEQARGERDLTASVDVFALGCVLFECLVGESPFAAEQAMAVLARILFADPPKLRFVRPEMPGTLEGLLARMLAKSPADRIRDGAGILAALGVLDTISGSGELSLAVPAASSDTEQHLVSVLVVTFPLRDDTTEDPREAHEKMGTTVAAGRRSTPASKGLRGLGRALEAYGARVELLADGSLVATLIDARGTATDQAAQAARCALLIKAHQPEASIALCTGRGRLRERLPMGEVLDRATMLLRGHGSTMQVEPGEPGSQPSERILLDEVTRGLLDARFDVSRSPSGALLLVGEALAVDASRPLLGKPTPCVGREAEVGMLELMLSGCIEDGSPRAVLVTAPPGTGKSRLRHELVRRAVARPEGVQILLGRGDPMTAGSAYGLLGQALRGLAGILDGEGLSVRRSKLTRRVAEHLPAADRGRVVAFVGELCLVPFPEEDEVKLRAARQDPLVMGDQIALAVIDLLRAEAAAHPLLLVLEDLHWGDALTVKLCEIALRELPESPLMMLALARPEVAELLPPSWAGFAQPLPLRPLSRRACERLSYEVLGAGAARETVARIAEQCAGNALFLEELIRSQAEGRGGEVPETVLAILQARIGRLDPAARRALRAASVFGETSWEGGIRALLEAGAGAPPGSVTAPLRDDWLPVLTGAEILEERIESRFPGEREVRFRHGLMRDAAYGLMTTNDRAEGHRSAALYLEARGEQPLVLAEHFEQGREARRAIAYYVQAAEQSFEANDVDATLSCADRGLRAGAEGEARGALLSLLCVVYLGRERYGEIVALGVEALGLLPEGGRRFCRVFYALFPAVTMTHQIPLLGELSSRFARTEPSPDARGEYLQATVWLSVAFALTGRKDASRAFTERARQILVTCDPRDLSARGSMKGAESNDWSCIEERPWSGTILNAEGAVLLRAAGDQRTECLCHVYHGKCLHELGDHAGAEAVLREALALAERLNEPLVLAYARTYLARLLADVAPPERLAEPARLAADAVAAKNLSLLGIARGALAEVARRRGDLEGAEVEAAAACAAARPFPPYSWDLVARRARILAALGRSEEALSVAEEALRELERLGVSGYGEVALRLEVAEARHAAGQVDTAREALAEALRGLWTRLGDIPEAAARERYLTEVPAHARLLALAGSWLGDEAARPPPSAFGA